MPTSIGPCRSHDEGMRTPWELYSFYSLCPDYVIHHPVYKSDPLYGLDLSLLLKGLTLQRYPVLRVYPSLPITGLCPRMDSDTVLVGKFSKCSQPSLNNWSSSIVLNISGTHVEFSLYEHAFHLATQWCN